MKHLLLASAILLAPTIAFMSTSSLSNVQGTIYANTPFTPATTVAAGTFGVVPAEPVNPTSAYKLLTNAGSGSDWQTAAQVKTAMGLTQSTRAYAYATNTSSQSFASLANGTVTNWTEVADTGNNFVPATGIFTCPRPGFYRVDAGITATVGGVNAGNQVSIQINVNNANRAANFQPAPTTTSWIWGPQVSATLQCNAGDTINVVVFNGSGASFTLDSGTPQKNYITIVEEPATYY